MRIKSLIKKPARSKEVVWPKLKSNPLRFLNLTLVPLTLFASSVRAFNVLPKDVRTEMQAVTANHILGHTRFLSHDHLEGRLPGTKGDELARLYIASSFESMGLQPLTSLKDSWFQEFNLVGLTTEQPEITTLRKGEIKLNLKNGTDLVMASGIQQETPTVIKNAELVFVGYGISAPEYKWDDYKNQNLEGKILVFLNNDPAHDPKLFEGKNRLYYGRWTYKYEMAAKKKALGALIIHTNDSAGYGWKVVQNSFSGEKFYLPKAPEETLPMMGWISEEQTKKIFELAGKTWGDLVAMANKSDFKPVNLGVSLATQIKSKVRQIKTANVLAVIPGSDPKLKQEYVTFMAHHDHLGICEKDVNKKDRICNGAVDNASGVASILSIAKIFSNLKIKPRRSILFAAVGAEEQGMLGSEYLAKYPAIHPGKISASINIDGVGIFGRTQDLIIVGKGKSNLDAIITSLAKEQGRTTVADPFPDRGFFYRSDQFNTAKVGIPSTHFYSGTKAIGRPENWGKDQFERWESEHYHQVSDEVRPDWNLMGALEDLQLAFALGYQLAQQENMAQWNPRDEFELIRMKSLEEVRTLKSKP